MPSPHTPRWENNGSPRTLAEQFACASANTFASGAEKTPQTRRPFFLGRVPLRTGRRSSRPQGARSPVGRTAPKPSWETREGGLACASHSKFRLKGRAGAGGRGRWEQPEECSAGRRSLRLQDGGEGEGAAGQVEQGHRAPRGTRPPLVTLALSLRDSRAHAVRPPVGRPARLKGCACFTQQDTLECDGQSRGRHLGAWFLGLRQDFRSLGTGSPLSDDKDVPVLAIKSGNLRLSLFY